MSYFKNQIIPYLGEIKVQDLTPAMLDNHMRKLLKEKLARNTLMGIYSLLKSALNYAVYPTQLISSNPAAYIKVPRNAPRNVVKRHIISRERFTELLAKYPFGSPMYIPLLLLYHTGMRLGEMLGLTWQDVDFSAKKITVRRQIVYLKGRGYSFTTLKTESSNRYILIDNFLLGELQRWKNQQAANEDEFGDTYVYVYRKNDGRIERRSKGLPPPATAWASLSSAACCSPQCSASSLSPCCSSSPSTSQRSSASMKQERQKSSIDYM